MKTKAIDPFYFDATALNALGRAHREAFVTARPFSHIVLDDVLPNGVVETIVDEFPGVDDIRWDNYTDGGHTEKLATADVAKMGPTTRQVIGEFAGGPFIGFLEELTGITGLVADPLLMGGGLHRIEPGGFLDVHADFNRHPTLNLDRRLNVLLYLNRGWDPAWGGELELWDERTNRCEAQIQPMLGRMVVFATTDNALHGHPTPLAAPPGTARRSLAFYYYTNGRPEAERSAPHTTQYRGEDNAPAPAPKPIDRAVGLGRRAVRKAEALLRDRSTPSSAPRPAPAHHWEEVNQWYDDLTAAGDNLRSNYTWSVLHVAGIAKRLGMPEVSVVEFGVAGGNGLVALEAAARGARRVTGVGVEVHGFDTGSGLPKPIDHRDAPYLMAPGEFPMDVDALRARLTDAHLHLGLIATTLDEFINSDGPPVGFVGLDVDFYSSSVDALRLFQGRPERLMPRVLLYLDDVLGYPWGRYNGEELAVREHNERYPQRPIAWLRGFKWNAHPSQRESAWVESMYLGHVIDHPRYSDYEASSFGPRLDLRS